MGAAVAAAEAAVAVVDEVAAVLAEAAADLVAAVVCRELRHPLAYRHPSPWVLPALAAAAGAHVALVQEALAQGAAQARVAALVPVAALPAADQALGHPLD